MKCGRLNGTDALANKLQSVKCHLKELFENVNATSIIDFIKEVNFYHLV